MAYGVMQPLALYSVEVAQVISGVVTLRHDLPMAIHHGRVFSILIDAAAALLYIGLTEDTVCRVMTALMGGLAAVTMSVVAFAFTRNYAAAYLAPLLAAALPAEADIHKYPLYYPISEHDMGVNGFHLALLTLGLLAVRVRAGAVMLGLMPGLHASLAVAVWSIAGIGMLFDRQKARELCREWRWLAAGIAVVLAAWVAHQLFTPAMPRGPADASPAYARAIMAEYDGHRAPLHIPGLWVISYWTADLLFLAVSGVAIIRGALAPGTRFWVCGQWLVTIVAMIATTAEEFRTGWAPLPVAALLLSRWLNLNVIVGPALVAGWAIRATSSHAPAWLARRDPTALARAIALTTLVVILAITVTRGRREIWGDNRALFDFARSRSGVLMTAHDIDFAQVATGRAVLLETNLIDIVSYAPAAGPAVERILNEAYGASVLSPGLGDTLREHRLLWESWDDDDWRRVRQTLGVTDVLFPADWRIALPRIATSRSLALSALPE